MTDKKVPDTACIIPWIGMEVNSLGNYRPCCLMDGYIQDEHGEDFEATEVTLSEAFQSKWMQDFRQQFLDGKKPEACKKCWAEEDAGRTSKRINAKSNMEYLKNIEEVDYHNIEPENIYYMDLKLGNICNFQCRICGSHSSNKLINEEIAFVSPHAKHGHVAHTYRKKGLWPRSAPDFWEDLKQLLPTVLYFELTGGEPWLIKEQFELLQFAVDVGEAHHIELHYNTNGSQWPAHATEIWKHFKALRVAFSIDNVGPRFEYERKNGNWETTQYNIAKMHEFKAANDTATNITTQICLTVNIQNVYYLKDLCDWGLTQDFDHFYFNMLHYPDSMSIANMTPEAQELVINKLSSDNFAPQHQRDIQNIINFIRNGEGSDGSEFAKRMFMFDTSRGESFDKLYPEMSEAMRFVPHIKPKHLCMAPWVHTYISPQSERRMCCASRESAQNFKQYIDTKGADGQYNPITIQEHWNSTHMKDVRVRMMAGEQLPECANCDMNPSAAYKDYFWNLFGNYYYHVIGNTEADGTHDGAPISWDYRISNLCNFKCRMCGDMLSSSWEAEMKKHKQVDMENPKNFWMKPEIRGKIHTFQKNVVYKELQDAVENHSVKEIYWVGGEPLMMEEHWETMNRLIELGDIKEVYARYNTNLSNLSFKGLHLYKDILPKTQNWEICASIDANRDVGEYIRTGLDWDQWLRNFKEGMKIQTRPGQMRLDLTVTLPGLIVLKDMFDLSRILNVQILTKTVLAYSPDIFMSPQCLPRELLNTIVDEHLAYMEPLANWRQQSIIDVLKGYKTLPTLEEQWPDCWEDGMAKGKGACETLERIRTQKLTMSDILRVHEEASKWWESITPISEQEYSNRQGERGQY